MLLYVETKIIYFVLFITSSHCLLIHSGSLLLLLNIISLNLNYENKTGISLQRPKYSPLLCVKSKHVNLPSHCNALLGMKAFL